MSHQSKGLTTLPMKHLGLAEWASLLWLYRLRMHRWKRLWMHEGPSSPPSLRIGVPPLFVSV